MIPVALAKARTYETGPLKRAIASLLDGARFKLPAGSAVLVKPNLVSATNAGLSCTHPAVVRAVAELALDAGARVTVADSPAFGSGAGVAAKAGYKHVLAGLDVTLAGMGKPVAVRLHCGIATKISAMALEADLLLGVPRLKAHGQMCITAAVKNLFGCVLGGRKALAHYLHGDKGDLFPSLLLEVAGLFPRQLHVLDGVTAMHVDGPIKGQPFNLGLLGAAENPMALDTAVYALLGLQPAEVPLWRVAQGRDLPGTDPAGLEFSGLAPKAFDATGFVVPEKLQPETFDPYRLLKGRLKSLREKLAG